jgi:hypothetical protein
MDLRLDVLKPQGNGEMMDRVKPLTTYSIKPAINRSCSLFCAMIVAFSKH